MITLQATPAICNPIQMARVRSPLEAFEALRAAATDRAYHLIAGVQNRWTMRILSRFSDHRLLDLGFERDWDGTVIPVVDDK